MTAILAVGGTKDRDGLRFTDVALLSASSRCLALGAVTVEQFKHLTTACAGFTLAESRLV